MTYPLRHVVLFAAGLLSGCASFSPDGGMESVRAILPGEVAKDAALLRTPEDAQAARDLVAVLLQKPLSADNAARIALLNNRDLQASYNALGLSEAAMVQASLPPNPGFKFSRLAGGGELEIERQIALNILSLVTLPARAEIAADRFRQAQFRAAGETLRVALEARRAFFRAVAARELMGFLGQAKSAAETATQLSKRLGESGAATKLDQARNQVFYAELATQVALSQQRVTSERERLTRALGLWGSDLDLRLPAALPALPSRPRASAAVEIDAVRRRVDLQAARLEVEALAKSYNLTGATRFINLLEVGGKSKTVHEPDGSHRHEQGFEVEFQVPLFDFGEVRQRRAEASYLEAVNRLTARAVNARSEAREAYQAYRSSYDVARHYRREILPLRKIISDETLLRYNAMQIDEFALLAEARQRIASTSAAIEAQRDFWLADANLSGAILIGGGGAAPEGGAPVNAPVEAPGAH
jgi:outer membrane protein TolC